MKTSENGERVGYAGCANRLRVPRRSTRDLSEAADKSPLTSPHGRNHVVQLAR